MMPQLAFDPYILQQASCRASAMVSRAGFSRDYWEDLRQELVLDCLQRAPRFNPARGDWPAFVRGVIRNQSAALALRESRRIRCEALATGDEGGDFDDEGACSAPEPASDDPSDELALSADVRRVIDSLPENLRTLARDLMGMTVAEVAAKRGTSAQWIYQLIKRLRKAFVQAGVTPDRLRDGGVR
jgi:RNA polymerase sigma-70 factor (ECF subfamily)